MASFNRVILVGNLTRDPELRYIPSGTAVTEIGLAVNNRRKTPNGDWAEEPVFVDVTLWERNAEVAAEYLRKGSPVLIEGHLKMDQWQDKNTGDKRSKLKVVGERLQLLGTKGGSGAGGAKPAQRGGFDEAEYGAPSESYAEPSGAPTQPPADDIPF
ncbi:MAG TPA: single-stranded DNA-binding protein [Pirellulales bacterium]|nr:single-stranded DNA-binding protein [Pirellulales bacterium]